MLRKKISSFLLSYLFLVSCHAYGDSDSQTAFLSYDDSQEGLSSNAIFFDEELGINQEDTVFTLYPICILSYAAGRYISINNNYGSLELFSPLLSSSSSYLPFIDLQVYSFSNGLWATSCGIGIRKQISTENIIGVNAYYDAIQSRSRTNFHQIGLGVEWLSPCGDIRVNSYLPVSQKIHTYGLCVFDQLGDGFFATQRHKEYAYTGFDVEAGLWVWKNADFRIYAAAGPYYFYRPSYHQFFGCTARAVFSWKSFLSLQGSITADRIYSTRFQAILACTIPLDFFCASSNCRCDTCDDYNICVPPQRNGIILTDRCCDWTWNW